MSCDAILVNQFQGSWGEVIRGNCATMLPYDIGVCVVCCVQCWQYFGDFQFKRVMEGIEKQINDFYSQWQYYCYPDKTERCRGEVDAFLHTIDRLQDETNVENKKDKAKLLYLKGKILDLLPAYEKSAEEYLNKSIKLNPKHGDCWNTMAHVLFKKGDIEGSSKAVAMALQELGKNKVSLRYQSVLLRSAGISKDSQSRMKNVEQSLKVIKSALPLDFNDAATWYFLGNAYFSHFVANFKKFDELEHAIKAYNKAEELFRHKYPDLFLNRANVEAHIENYESATKDYLAAYEIDKDPSCLQHVEVIKRRMELTKQVFQRAGEIKQAKISEMIQDIPNSINNNKDKLELVAVSKLKLRYNPQSLLTGKIFARISNFKEVPFSYLAIDSEGHFFTLSLYNVDTEKVDQKLKKDAIISVLHPEAKVIHFESFKYTSVQIFEPVKLRVNNAWLTKEDFSPAELRNETFEK